MVNRKIALDTETTGLNPKEGHKIVEIGCVELEDNIPTGRQWHTYLNPKRNIPEAAVAVHGLEEKFLLDKPIFKEIAESFLNFLKEDIMVIHNAKFDIGFLNHELAEANFSLLDIENTIDTVQLSRQTMPGAPASLDALCKRFDIDLTKRQLHGALLDAQLLSEVYLELTGGRQGRFSLNNTVKSQNSNHLLHNKTSEKRQRVSVKLSKTEIEQHNKFIKNISGSIWNKS